MNKKPNIILITVDALRADHLGFMGYEKNISPNIDNLSKESNIFTRAFSVGPMTPYSFPSILTSTYPLDCQGPEQIKKPRVLISEVFKKQGFITAAFHSSPYLSDYFGYDKGWDFFEDMTLSSCSKNFLSVNRTFKGFLKKILVSTYPQLLFWRNYLEYKIKGPKSVKVKASFVNRIIKDSIRSIRIYNKPFFLWVHYMDIHTPPPCYLEGKKCSYSELIASYIGSAVFSHGNKNALRRFVKNHFKKHLEKALLSYDSGIQYLDQELGDLLNFLKKEGIYRNSVICFAGDHGEEFSEHGGVGHNNQPYNEVLKVPLLIKTIENKNKIVNKKVSLIDLPTTLCNLAGVDSDPSFKGGDLFSKERDLIFHQMAFSEKENSYTEIEELNQCKVACQSETWKYILDYNTKKEELYDLSQDPKEQNNLILSKTEILLKMRKSIQDFNKRNPPLSS